MCRMGYALMLSALAALLAGCTSDSKAPSESASAAAEVASDKGGAQLWAENCSRCHNVRSPKSFSDSQWQVITHHMRLRANLTGQEARAITEFLQSSD